MKIENTTTEEMEHYYQLAKAGNHSTPQEGEA
jgi:hypothetical protein